MRVTCTAVTAAVRGLLVGFIAVATSRCGDGAVGPSFEQPDVRPWVTGAAAQAVDANGHFVYSAAAISAPYPAVDEARAIELAAAYLRTFATNAAFVSGLTAQRGGAATDFAALTPVSRVEYSASPYESVALTDEEVSRRRYGPVFIVRVLERGLPAVSVRVSAHATNMQIDNGFLVYPAQSGGEFGSIGTPTGAGHRNPVSPEAATEAAGRATKAKVSELPLLLAPDRTHAFPSSRWRLRLDRDVTLEVIATGRVIVTRELYVGLIADGIQRPTAFFVPAMAQPTSDTIPGNPPLVLHVRPDAPIRFEEARVVQ